MLPSNLSFLKTENILPGQNKDNNIMESESNTKKEGDVFKCEICNKCFTQKYRLENHISNLHEVKNGFKCDLCDKTFKNSHYKKKHVLVVHEKIKMYKCDLCEQSFGRNYVLAQHKRLKHENSNTKKIFECGQCDKTSTTLGNLNVHISSVHDNKKDFKVF